MNLRPLITAGVIVPFTPTLEYCPCCLAEKCLSSETTPLFREMRDQLENDYLERVEYKFRWNGRNYETIAKGPELLIEHGRRKVRHTEIPHKIRSFPQVLRKARTKSGVTFSSEEVLEFGCHRRYLNDVLENIAFELTTAQSLKTSFLTERSLHIEVLNKLNQNPDIERRNRIAQEYLTSLVPFLSNVSLKDLMKLRREESEAFIVYRAALNEAIDEYRRTNANFSAKDAQALYLDVIAPRLSALDQKVTTAKRTLVKETVHDALAWTGAISFGVYAGFIPSDLIAAAGVLGMGKVVADFLRSTMSRMNSADKIRSEDMYFLWKVRQLNK
jgi:hypothetical protein